MTLFNDYQHLFTGKLFLTDSLSSPELSLRSQSPLPFVWFPFLKNEKKPFISEESILSGAMSKCSTFFLVVINFAGDIKFTFHIITFE